MVARRIGLLLAGAVVALGACALRVAGSGSWELGMITPDERGLLVWFGTRSGLDSFTVTEDEDAVTIDVRVKTVLGPSGGSLPFDFRYVELGEPLGDRELRGCLRDDCRKFIFDLAQGGDAIGITPDVVATGYPDHVQHVFDRSTGRLIPDAEPIALVVPPGQETAVPAGVPDLAVRVDSVGLYVENRSDGQSVWSTSLLPGYEGGPVMADDLVVIGASGPGEQGPRIIAFDIRTAEVRWEYEPFIETLEASADVVVTSTGFRSTELVALDVMTGQERWRTDLRAVMGDVRATETELFVSIQDGLMSLDPATGDIVWWSHVDAGLWTPPN